MTRKLQFLFTVLLLVVGVTSAWAKIVWPNSLVQYRTSSAISEETNSWSDGYPKDGKTMTKIEANTNYNMWFLEEFTIHDMANVTSITMPFVYNGSDTQNVNIYLWNSTYPGAGETYNKDFVSAVNTTIGDNANIFGTITSSSTTLIITGSGESDNLTKLKNAFGSTGSVTVKFLVYYGGTEKYKSAFHGGAAAVPSRRPHLEVSYSGVTNAIVNNTTSTGYSDLSTAATAATAGDVLTLNDDCFLTARLTLAKNLTFKAAENKDVIIYKWSDFNSQTVLCNGSNCTITFDGSNTGASLTIDNQNVSKDKEMFKAESSSCFTFKNVTIRNYTTGSSVLTNNNNSTGVNTFENVTFNSCNPTTAVINNVSTTNDIVILKGALNFTNCDDAPAHISTSKRIKVGDTNAIYDDFSVTGSNIKINWGGATTTGSGPVVIKTPGTVFGNTGVKFELINEDCGLFRITRNGDLMVTAAYTLTVGEAETATLCLPFNATIQSGATAYNLTTYTSGDNINAASVEAITANQAVLVKADAGSYKFTPKPSWGSELKTSGQTSANGVLIGNYDASWTVPVQTDSKDNYILRNKASGLGFYKVVEGQNTLSPYRAYLSASFTSGSSARGFLGIRFGGDITDIQSVENEETDFNDDDAPVYNMSGMLMQGGNLPKGIYVKKGKKFIVK